MKQQREKLRSGRLRYKDITVGLFSLNDTLRLISIGRHLKTLFSPVTGTELTLTINALMHSAGELILDKTSVKVNRH